MAEPGDPQTFDDGARDAHRDHDDLIGFTSAASLSGVERRPPAEPVPQPPVAALTPMLSSEPVHAGRDDPGDDLFDELDLPPVKPVAAAVPPREAGRDAEVDALGALYAAPSPVQPSPAPVQTTTADAVFDTPQVPRPDTTESREPAPPSPAPSVSAAMSAIPAWARETVRPPKATPEAGFGQSRRVAPPEGAMGLYAVYALILFAVPTMGVSALIALLAVTGRPLPEQALARSHFLFQKRTLWIAAVSAAIGVVLIAVNLGVFVLFIMALWVLVRGTAGLLRLASGRPMNNPMTWAI